MARPIRPHGRAELVRLYGDPAGVGFEAAQIVRLEDLPYPMVTAWSGERVRSIRCHRLIEDELRGLLTQWRDVGAREPGGVQGAGLHLFAGGYVMRRKRGLQTMSVHSWGLAFDFDSARNPLGATRWHMPEWAVAVAERRGWIWGGRFKRSDPMHFQWASGY